jgi:hypothetical protein
LTDPVFYRSMQLEKSPFGDGQSARGVVDILTETNGLDAVVPSFAVPIHHPMEPLPVAAYG